MGRGVYGRAAGVSILSVTLCVCVVLYSFTKHVLSSHSGDFVNHGVTDHGAQRMRVMLWYLPLCIYIT